MKRGIWIAIAVGIVLILVGVVVILMFVPLGPSLSIFKPNPTLTQFFKVGASETPVISTAPVPVETITPSQHVCGSGSLTLMALGESQPPRGTDAIRLVRVDFDRKRVDVLALPQELWVGTPGLFNSGTGGTTLNEVYLLGKAQASGDDRARMLAAVNLFAITLQANFGYFPDHYVVIKQAAFSDFVNSLNGVDVVLPVVVDGRPEGMRYFPAGSQHLDGAMALDLVRISTPDDWDRLDRQELIIQAIYHSVISPQNWDRLPALIQTIHDDILTDLSVSEFMDFSCILNEPGVVLNQAQVGPEFVVRIGVDMLPSQNLGQYILQTVGK